MINESFEEFAAKFGEAAERTIEDKITVHNYPYGKPNRIFSVGEHPRIRENIFAATVKGVSYLGSIDDFNREYLVKSEEFLKEIPLGNTMLDLYERISIFEEGKKIWENRDCLMLSALSEEERKKRKLELYAQDQREHYTIVLPDRLFDGKFCIWMGNMRYPAYSRVDSGNIEEVIQLASQFSGAYHIPCLVAKCVYSCNWH